MTGERDPQEVRVALIGKTGCGKSALGNTLVGFRCFKSTPAGESVTIDCQEGRGTLPSGQTLRVVDTPGILDTMKRNVRLEVTRSIGFLSPGPHAFIIVLSPNRATEEERRVVSELNALFGDKKFLDHTIIVMVRKNEIRDENGDEMDIHKFIDKQAADDVKALYQECGRRIVAVENLASVREKQTYAKEVVDKISTLDGYYSHEYFLLLEERRLNIDQTAELEKALEEKAKESNRSFCSIL